MPSRRWHMPPSFQRSWVTGPCKCMGGAVAWPDVDTSLSTSLLPLRNYLRAVSQLAASEARLAGHEAHFAELREAAGEDVAALELGRLARELAEYKRKVHCGPCSGTGAGMGVWGCMRAFSDSLALHSWVSVRQWRCTGALSRADRPKRGPKAQTLYVHHQSVSWFTQHVNAGGAA